MTFSYTDDAIVSASPTGRHLSTVIKRPVVLMSGWNEHAEAICKVLNDLQPDHPIGCQHAQWKDGEGKAYAADYSPLEARAAEHYVRMCAGRETPAETYTVRLTIGGREAFKTVPAEDAAPMLFDALKDRDDKLAAVTAELEELQSEFKKPIDLTAELACSLYHAKPGSQFYTTGNLHTLKRV